MTQPHFSFPQHGRSRADLLAEMTAARDADIRWQDGKVFSLVFHAGDEASTVVKDAYNLFFSENGLNPTAFPSLRRFEAEVVAMAADLFGSNGRVVGNMTSGGTESILMTVYTAREWARIHRPASAQPEILLPVSGHPAFEKAAHYFGLKITHIPVGPDLRADIAATAAAVSPDTVLIVGSAPSYPHGLVDPIPELAALAQQHGILCHVDACVGGFLLPFVRQLGHDVPAFDFAVPGVTSMSADLHKYGYAAKGASLILYRDADLHRHQLFAYMDWPGGIYASPTMAGTRPGGAIAAAWAILNYLGQDGYREIVGNVMATAVAMREGINAIDGVRVLGQPPASIMAIASDTLNIYEVGDEMAQLGWHLDRQQFPPSLHITVNAAHIGKEAAFLRDLATAVARARKTSLHKLGNTAVVGVARLAARLLPPALISRLTNRAGAAMGGSVGPGGRSAAMYGMMGTLPNRGDLRELVLDMVAGFTALPAEGADAPPDQHEGQRGD